MPTHAAIPSDAELGLDPNVRRVHNRFFRWLGKTWLRATGFRAVGRRPPEAKYVMIAAPHTSNWDLVYMLAMSFVFDIKLSWLGKHTLFETALGPLLRLLGGIPVDRRSPQNLVEQVAARFAEADELILAVPPEGTRSYRDHWKTGFYYIALSAKVPIVASVLDYGNKTGTMHAAWTPSGNLEDDLEHLREVYADATPHTPANMGPISVRPRVDEQAA